MVRARTITSLPAWAFVLAAMLLLFAVHSQSQITRTLPFGSQAHHVSAPQLEPGPINQPVVGNQPANGAGSNSSVMTKTGTTSPAQQPAEQPVLTNPTAGNPASNPCARAGKPAPMCAVTAH
ncbi:MAG TPA: hypothetical protein VJS19_12145 [Candidatus Dormibacteraeota bacterium]|nr:hypothetical protein [Candidatus Dormibacteraeota bacterium]